MKGSLTKQVVSMTVT